jgi:hypothetical protein
MRIYNTVLYNSVQSLVALFNTYQRAKRLFTYLLLTNADVYLFFLKGTQA